MLSHYCKVQYTDIILYNDLCPTYKSHNHKISDVTIVILLFIAIPVIYFDTCQTLVTREVDYRHANHGSVFIHSFSHSIFLSFIYMFQAWNLEIACTQINSVNGFWAFAWAGVVCIALSLPAGYYPVITIWPSCCVIHALLVPAANATCQKRRRPPTLTCRGRADFS